VAPAVARDAGAGFQDAGQILVQRGQGDGDLHKVQRGKPDGHVQVAGDEVVLGDDAYGVAEIQQDLEAAAGKGRSKGRRGGAGVAPLSVRRFTMFGICSEVVVGIGVGRVFVGMESAVSECG
jgi:hypothetical protein